MRFSLGHNSPHTPPKVAPRPPASLPSIGIHKLQVVPQAGPSKLRNVPRTRNDSRGLKRRATALIEIELILLGQSPWRPVRRWTCRRCRIGPVGDVNGYGGVAACDEIHPDGHEGFVESGALVGGRRAVVRRHVCGVLGPDDGILILVGFAVVTRKSAG